MQVFESMSRGGIVVFVLLNIVMILAAAAPTHEVGGEWAQRVAVFAAGVAAAMLLLSVQGVQLDAKLGPLGVQLAATLYLLVVPVKHEPWLIPPVIIAAMLLFVARGWWRWVAFGLVIVMTVFFFGLDQRFEEANRERAEEHARMEAAYAAERAERAAAARAREAAIQEKISQERKTLGREWRIVGQEWPVFVDSLGFDERGELNAFALEYSIAGPGGTSQAVRWQCRRTEESALARFDCHLHQEWENRSLRTEAVLYRTARTAERSFAGRYLFRHKWERIEFKIPLSQRDRGVKNNSRLFYFHKNTKTTRVIVIGTPSQDRRHPESDLRAKKAAREECRGVQRSQKTSAEG